jgi:hypothetical protein
VFNNGSGIQMCTAYKFSKQKYTNQAKYKQGTYQTANENFHLLYQAANENFHSLCKSEL